MLHEREFSIYDIPLPSPVPMAASANAHGDLLLARAELLRFQKLLAAARRMRVQHAIRHWERRVCQTLDEVFEAQENFKAMRRHWA